MSNIATDLRAADEASRRVALHAEDDGVAVTDDLFCRHPLVGVTADVNGIRALGYECPQPVTITRIHRLGHLLEHFANLRIRASCGHPDTSSSDQKGGGQPRETDRARTRLTAAMRPATSSTASTT
jgi:hypothetical protein